MQEVEVSLFAEEQLAVDRGHHNTFLAAAGCMLWLFLAQKHVLMRLAAAIVGT